MYLDPLIYAGHFCVRRPGTPRLYDTLDNAQKDSTTKSVVEYLCSKHGHVLPVLHETLHYLSPLLPFAGRRKVSTLSAIPLPFAARRRRKVVVITVLPREKNKEKALGRTRESTEGHWNTAVWVLVAGHSSITVDIAAMPLFMLRWFSFGLRRFTGVCGGTVVTCQWSANEPADETAWFSNRAYHYSAHRY